MQNAKVTSPNRPAFSANAIVVGLSVLFWLATSWASYVRWANFQYRTFDLAYYVQGLWQLIHGRFQVSVENVPLLGNHVEPIVFLLAPLFALIRHPMLLVVVQNAGLAAMGPIACNIGKRLGLAPRPGGMVERGFVPNPGGGLHRVARISSRSVGRSVSSPHAPGAAIECDQAPLAMVSGRAGLQREHGSVTDCLLRGSIDRGTKTGMVRTGQMVSLADGGGAELVSGLHRVYYSGPECRER